MKCLFHFYDWRNLSFPVFWSMFSYEILWSTFPNDKHPYTKEQFNPFLLLRVNSSLTPFFNKNRKVIKKQVMKCHKMPATWRRIGLLLSLMMPGNKRGQHKTRPPVSQCRHCLGNGELKYISIKYEHKCIYKYTKGG